MVDTWLEVVTYEVSGFAACGFYQRAKTLVLKLEQEREDVKAKVIEFDSRSDYKTALPQLKEVRQQWCVWGVVV